MNTPQNITDSLVLVSSIGDSTKSFKDSTCTGTNDSIQIHTKAIESIFSESTFINRQIEPRFRKQVNNDWVAIHLIVVFAMLAWVRVFYRKRFRQMFNAFFGQYYQGILVREGNIFRERLSIPLLLNYLVTFSIFIYLFLGQYVQFSIKDLYGFKLYSLIILVILVLWIIKNATLLFIGYLFKNPVILTEYIVTNFIFNINFGLFLLPVVIFATYLTPVWSLESGILLYLIVFVYRVFRQFFTGLSYTKFSLFNRLLYLCTFEIIPNLVLIKLILSNLK